MNRHYSHRRPNRQPRAPPRIPVRSTAWPEPATPRSRCGCTATVPCGRRASTSLARASLALRRPSGPRPVIAVSSACSTAPCCRVCNAAAQTRCMCRARVLPGGHSATTTSRADARNIPSKWNQPPAPPTPPPLMHHNLCIHTIAICVLCMFL